MANRKQSYQAKNESPDASLKLTVFLPGYKPVEVPVKMINFRGNTIGLRRTPEHLVDVIKNAIKKEYGSIVR